MTAASGVVPILGTMTVGREGQVKGDVAGTLLRSLIGASCAKTPRGVLVDTARMYQKGCPDGDTEATLGEIFGDYPSLAKRVSMATKANPDTPPHNSLSRQSVIDQCDTSLEKMELDCIDLFYLHYPDIKTDIDDTLSGIEELHKQGKILEFGLSNYPAWAVVDIWHRCKSRGMVLPTVYQGMYNVLTRDMEREIVPVARQFGLRLYMYNPLAGGLLSGKVRTWDDVAQAATGRFSSEFDKAFGEQSTAGTGMYRQRYLQEPIFEGLQILLKACAPAAAADGAAPAPVVTEDHTIETDGMKVRVIVEEKQREEKGLDLYSVALRWLIHHSLLRAGDGVILGVSKSEHLAANLGAWHAGPLPEELVRACDAAWEAARPACEPYFRGYGAQPGGVERFLALKEQTREEEESPEAKRLKS